jgi:hypothetical protein
MEDMHSPLRALSPVTALRMPVRRGYLRISMDFGEVTPE